MSGGQMIDKKVIRHRIFYSFRNNLGRKKEGQKHVVLFGVVFYPHSINIGDLSLYI